MTWTCCATGDGPAAHRDTGPSTLSTFLRCFTFGHVRQLDAIAARLLAPLVATAPALPDVAQLVFVDIDVTVGQTYGYAKPGAERGYTGRP